MLRWTFLALLVGVLVSAGTAAGHRLKVEVADTAESFSASIHSVQGFYMMRMEGGRGRMVEFTGVPPGAYLLDIRFRSGHEYARTVVIPGEGQGGSRTALRVSMQQTFFARDLGHAAHRISADELAGDESLQRSLRAFERAMGGNDPQRAETILRKAVEERPAASLGWGNLGGMLLQQKRVTEALPLLQRAFQLDRSQFEVTLNLARAHALTNNVGEALQYARLAVELRPGHPNALAMMVGILFQADRGNEAEPFLETLRQVDPQNLCRPELLLAALWESRGRRREAAELVISYADRHAGQPDAAPLRERALRMLDDGRQTLADARH